MKMKILSVIVVLGTAFAISCNKNTPTTSSNGSCTHPGYSILDSLGNQVTVKTQRELYGDWDTTFNEIEIYDIQNPTSFNMRTKVLAIGDSGIGLFQINGVVDTVKVYCVNNDSLRWGNYSLYVRDSAEEGYFCVRTDIIR